MGLFDFGKKKARVAEGPWQLYGYPFGEGLRATVVFNVRADEEDAHDHHPFCRRVILHLPHERVHANGLPMPDEHDRASNEEEALIAELERAAGSFWRKLLPTISTVNGASVAICLERTSVLASWRSWRFVLSNPGSV